VDKLELGNEKNTLERKRKLGHYVIKWSVNEAIAVGDDAVTDLQHKPCSALRLLFLLTVVRGWRTFFRTWINEEAIYKTKDTPPKTTRKKVLKKDKEAAKKIF